MCGYGVKLMLGSYGGSGERYGEVGDQPMGV